MVNKCKESTKRHLPCVGDMSRHLFSFILHIFLCYKSCLFIGSVAYAQMHSIFKSYFISKANSINADQTARLGSSLIWVHIVCDVGYESTPADEKADDICMNGGKMVRMVQNLKVLLFL